jgi:NADH dehydrogenase
MVQRQDGGSDGSMRLPRVVIVGAGFGGIHAARQLASASCQVLLMDRKNHHVFQPLLYQVATAALSPADIAAPIRGVFRGQRNVAVALGEVTGVDLEARQVLVGAEAIAFDWLVLAAGATHAYFGHDDWADVAPGLKTLDDALEIRRRVLLAFEEAELEDDEASRSAKLTFVVVGGGPTGVEMAGALREIAAETIPRDYRRVDTSTARVLLLEGGPRLLGGMSEESSDRALEALERMGVEVSLNTFVTGIEDGRVLVGDREIPAANVIWAAGVQGAELVADMGAPLDGQGRVRVEADCSIPGHPEAFVVGDLASLDDPDSGDPVPGVAQGAIQMGQFVGRIIAREVVAGPPRPSGSGPAGHDGAPARALPPRPVFRYRDKGNMATIGRARAVADLAGRSFGGFVAWLLWSVIHVLFLIGFRNKVVVMVNWAWQWLFQARGVRLITGSPEVRVTRPPDLSRPTDLPDS